MSELAKERNAAGTGPEPAPAVRPVARWAESVEPVFLVGAPRSGTTWLQAVLGAHPEIYTGTESWFFATFASTEELFRRPKDRSIGLSEYWEPAELYAVLAALFRQTISALPEPKGSPRYFLEKTPMHCFHVDLIRNVFPGARFLHLLRDGRAVIASLRRSADTWWRSNPVESVDEAAHVWNRCVRASRGIPEKVGGSAFLEARYEDLRERPEQEVCRILEWLDLDRNESLVSSMVAANQLGSRDALRSISLPAAASGSGRDSAYPRGFVGSAAFRVEDIQLTRLQRLRVEYLEGDLLRELGYPDVPRRFDLWIRLITSPRLRRLLRLPVL